MSTNLPTNIFSLKGQLVNKIEDDEGACTSTGINMAMHSIKTGEAY
ncbi:MAG: hypothetical protein ISEC1_P0493 [Thiomicrorhabdus sp.]|nr:MAG: hypothetical protein ISEC1_P0493 [Thiomicrorhabdus sp.]